MHHPPLKGGLLRDVGLMLAFDSVVLWTLFSWQYLDTLFSGEARPVAPLVNAVLVGATMAAALALAVTMPAPWKQALVFWRRRHAFSSRCAFSVLARHDHRYAPTALIRRLGPFPRDVAGQQALWQRLYLQHAQRPQLRQMYRQFLLCHEIAVVSLLAAVAMLVPVAWRWSAQQIVLISPLFLLGQYLMFVVAARTMGDDLVRAVLAIEATAEPHII